jgi:hypothetical protein
LLTIIINYPTSSLRAHDDRVSRCRLGRAKDLAMGATTHDEIVNLDPGPRLFGHQVE